MKSPVWLWAHYGHDYSSADKLAARATMAAVDRRAEFAFVVFPGIDWQSHYVDAEGAGAMALLPAGRPHGRPRSPPRSSSRAPTTTR